MPNQLASDNFHRADANPLSGSWTSVGTLNPLQIASNQAEAGGQDAGRIGCSVSTAASWPNDQYSEITLGTFATNGHYVGPCCRMDSSGNGYAVACTPGSNSSVLQKYSAGGGATLGSGFTLNPGDLVRLTASGTTITVTVNGTVVVTVTDATYASGSAGVSCYCADTSFSLVSISLWGAGNLLPAAAASEPVVCIMQ